MKVKLLDHSGNDLTAVNAARASFGATSSFNDDGSLKDNDKSLLKYLGSGLTEKERKKLLSELSVTLDYQEVNDMIWKWRDTPEHDTPFNHMFCSFFVEAPVYVSRQLVKHEYLIMSEFSRRYKTEGISIHTPEWRWKPEDKKQGSGDIVSDNQDVEDFNRTYLDSIGHSVKAYDNLLEQGVCPEQARAVLPLGLMVQWHWSGTFGAFAKMVRLRSGSDVQSETRFVAKKVSSILKGLYPESHKALIERKY